MSIPPSQGVELQLAFSAVRRHTTLPYSPHHGPRYTVIVTVYQFSLKGKGLMEVTEWVVCPHHACAPPLHVSEPGARWGAGIAVTAE